MDISHYDKQIQASTDEKNQQLRELESIRVSYIATYTKYCERTIGEMVERAVTKNPELAKSAGVNKLGELKVQLNGVLKEVPTMVSKQLDDDSLWEHRNPLPEGLDSRTPSSFQLRESAGGKLGGGFKSILAYAGKLIIDFGFDEPGEKSHWRRVPKGLPEYKYAVGFDDPELRKLTEAYKKAFGKYINAHIDILKKEREKEEAIARDLWDKA